MPKPGDMVFVTDNHRWYRYTNVKVVDTTDTGGVIVELRPATAEQPAWRDILRHGDYILREEDSDEQH
jgi:hypothetical protein